MTQEEWEQRKKWEEELNWAKQIQVPEERAWSSYLTD